MHPDQIKDIDNNRVTNYDWSVMTYPAIKNINSYKHRHQETENHVQYQEDQ